MKPWKILFLLLLLSHFPLQALSFTPSGLLEIHTINVQQGSATLIIGPDGTTILMDGGNNGKGRSEVVPYLQSIGLMPQDGLDYMIVSHLHADHCGGLDEVIQAGYDVWKRIYDNGSDYWTATVQDFKDAAASTSAGPSLKIPLGTVIPLGKCARVTCVVVDGEVLGHGPVPDAQNNENDRSVGILIEHLNFEYLFTGDLGGGEADSACTGRSTNQVDVETPLSQSLMRSGIAALLGSEGVEVLHVNHHGSESSMNRDYMNLLSPQVALISVGDGQNSNWNHPRKGVVENVLHAQASCITADSTLVLQTEEGYPAGSQTSYADYCVGDIVIKTEGRTTYHIEATGEVSQGPVEVSEASLPRVFRLEEVSFYDSSPGVASFELKQNYPNPFSCTTTILYQIPIRSYVSLKIFDNAGRLVRTLVEGEVQEGVTPVFWDGHNDMRQKVSNGVYFYRFQGKDFGESKKILLLR